MPLTTMCSLTRMCSLTGTCEGFGRLGCPILKCVLLLECVLLQVLARVLDAWDACPVLQDPAFDMAFSSMFARILRAGPYQRGGGGEEGVLNQRR